MEMNININSSISGGSAVNEQSSLQELLGNGEYEILLSQVKALFTESAADKNIDEPETFLQSMIEKTADALQRSYKQKHRSVQARGIAAAKARGVKCGRPEKELPENFGLIAQEQACGRISMRTAAGLCGMSVSTFARRKKKLMEMGNQTAGFKEEKSSKNAEANY